MICSPTPPATYICGCSKEAHTGGMIPDGWEWQGSRLLCNECLVTAATAPAAGAAPASTPIRQTGGADAVTSILLRSGVYLDLADPDCSRIAAVDIAAGLRQFRFSAQTPQPYTIAQHSLLVLQLVEPLAQEIGGEAGHALRWCALLHDAAEAFLHDITRPLKNQLPDYKRIEKQFETRLAAALQIRWTTKRHQIVKMADLQALAIEKRDLCQQGEDRRPWPILQGIRPASIAAIGIGRVWWPGEAEERFLEAFHQLRQIHAPTQEIAA